MGKQLLYLVLRSCHAVGMINVSGNFEPATTTKEVFMMHMSHHANEQIKARKITEAQLNEALQHGSRWHCPHNSDISYARRDHVFVVVAGGSWVLTAYLLED